MFADYQKMDAKGNIYEDLPFDKLGSEHTFICIPRSLTSLNSRTETFATNLMATWNGRKFEKRHFVLEECVAQRNFTIGQGYTRHGE